MADVTEDIAELALEVHRRPKQVAGVPSLVRHRGYWIDTPPDKTAPATHRINAQRQMLIAFANELHSVLMGRISSPFHGDSTFIVDNVSSEVGDLVWAKDDIAAVEFCMGDMLVEVTIAIHNDYVTQTIIFDLSKRPGGNTPSHVERDIDISAIRNMLSRIDADLRASNRGEANTSRLGSNGRYLLDDFWIRIDEVLFGGLERRASLFCDFRGIVVNPAALDHVHHHDTDGPPGASDLGRPYPHDDARECLEYVWPLVKATHVESSKMEFVACTMLDHRAVYISALGNSSRMSANGAVEPVKYILLTPSRSRWQTGRLIDRINTMGTLRLLALRNLKEIRVASIEARVLGDELASAIEDFQRNQNKSGSIKKLQLITEKVNNIGESVDDGFLYRINRSRYFVQSFKTILMDLRIDRIETWQPYDAFVRRKLFGTYDFIDRVGIRVEQLRQRLSAFVSNVQMETTLDLQTKIGSLAESGVRNQRKYMILQDIAEKVGVIAFTYYGGSALHHSVEDLICGGKKLGTLPAVVESPVDRLGVCEKNGAELGGTSEMHGIADAGVLILSSHLMFFVIAFFFYKRIEGRLRTKWAEKTDGERRPAAAATATLQTHANS